MKNNSHQGKPYRVLAPLFFMVFLFNGMYSQKTWQTIIPADGSEPIARHEAAFVKVKNRFYLLGGRRIQPVSIFDPKTKTWSEGAAPPIEMHHFQPIVHKNIVYIVGAMTSGYPGETPVPNIYSYDPESDTWEQGPKISSERLRGSTGNVLVGNTIYVACGIRDGHRNDHKTWLDTYNIKTGEWTVLPDAPRARDHFQATVVHRKIYLLGGRQSKAPKETFKHTLNEVDVYDIKSGKWQTLATKLPTERAGNMAISHKSDIFVIGGESEGQKSAHDEVEVLDTKTGEFTTYPKLQRGRHGSGLLLHKNAIYVASGSGNKGGSPELKTMEKYELR